MAPGSRRRSVSAGRNSGRDATSVSSEFQGDLADMPDWARPLETPSEDVDAARESVGHRAKPRIIAELPTQPDAAPQSIEELRAAMVEIMAQPTAEPKPKSKRRRISAESSNLHQGQEEELTDDQWREKARGILLRQLTASDKTSKQLRDKLIEKDCPDHIAEEVIARYAEINLVDDQRFAKSWVVARARSRGLARGALKHELRAKGIDAEAAAEALEQIDDASEEERARELVRVKLRPESMGTDRDKALRRLVGMLGRKGYNGSMAFRVAREEWDARFGQDF